MGNCIAAQKSSTTTIFYDDDDEWDEDVSSSSSSNNINNNGGKGSTTTSKEANHHHHHHKEVKIKITKKQLAELLGKMDVKELRVEQVLAHLMDHSNSHHYYSHSIPWRPALQSIPE